LGLGADGNFAAGAFDTLIATRNSCPMIAKHRQLAFIFPAATVVGWLIGAGLDRWLHTTWLYLAGLILGIIAGFVELIRLVTSSESKS
jgi:F0F1-type ATP synthase assembly protein I